MEINDLVIEVTRKCQLSCAHCLRGESQPKVITKKIIRELLTGVSRINSVTFTGGEPFLHPEVIEDFIKICTTKNISVGSFFIATNGIIFAEKSKLASRGLMAIIDLWNFCDSNEDGYSTIKVSLDEFHYNNRNAGKLLKAFSFVDFNNSDVYSIILEGNAIDNIDPYTERTKDPVSNVIPLYFYESMLYCSVEGKIVFDCDMSFERIDEEGISIKEGKEVIRKLWKQEQE